MNTQVFNFPFYPKLKVCTSCAKSQHFSKYEDNSTVCIFCRPTEKILKALIFIEENRETVECKTCGKSLVYYYRKDGKKVDLSGLAREGMKLSSIKRLMTQTTPRCDECATPPTRESQLKKQAEGWKFKAIKEEDEKLKAHYWRNHYRILKNIQYIIESKNSEPDVEHIEIQDGWDGDWYGGTDDI